MQFRGRPEIVREESLKLAKKIRISLSSEIPLLPDEVKIKDNETVAGRMLAVHALLAVVWGTDNAVASRWVDQEGIAKYLTVQEHKFLFKKQGYFWRFVPLVEGLWAFAWTMNLVEKIDYNTDCSNHLASLFPNIKTDERGDKFRANLERRALDEVFQVYDLGFCLSFQIMRMAQDNKKLPSKVKMERIIERRKSLEWILSDKTWEEITVQFPRGELGFPD
jgi:hypothetical protein